MELTAPVRDLENKEKQTCIHVHDAAPICCGAHLKNELSNLADDAKGVALLPCVGPHQGLKEAAPSSATTARSSKPVRSANLRTAATDRLSSPAHRFLSAETSRGLPGVKVRVSTGTDCSLQKKPQLKQCSARLGHNSIKKHRGGIMATRVPGYDVKRRPGGGKAHESLRPGKGVRALSARHTGHIHGLHQLSEACLE